MEPRTPLKRQRIPVERFQSPVLEDGTPKLKPPKEEIIVHYKKGVFLAVRGAESEFYITCYMIVINVYKTRKCFLYTSLAFFLFLLCCACNLMKAHEEIYSSMLVNNIVSNHIPSFTCQLNIFFTNQTYSVRYHYVLSCKCLVYRGFSTARIDVFL